MPELEGCLAGMHAGALARGDAAINLRFPHKGYREKIWDHVAGVVIATEAGATISDASGMRSFIKCAEPTQVEW